MPDWISHILIGLTIAELFNFRKKSLIVLGSLLPDFIVKIYLLSFFFPVNSTIMFMSTLYHSIVMGFILPALLVPLFRFDLAKTYFQIMLGFMLHLVADSFTESYGGGVLMYPLYHGFFSFRTFWINEFWIFLVGSLIAYAAVKFVKYKLANKNTT